MRMWVTAGRRNGGARAGLGAVGYVRAEGLREVVAAEESSRNRGRRKAHVEDITARVQDNGVLHGAFC